MRDLGPSRWLLVESGGHACALPIACVRETLRPQPIQALRGAPDFVLGFALIRGRSVPVVDLGGLLSERPGERSFGRFVTLAVEEREVALAVDAVHGVSTLDERACSALPPLLGRAAAAVAEALLLHDERLLLLLRAGRLIPDRDALERALGATV